MAAFDFKKKKLTYTMRAYKIDQSS